MTVISIWSVCTVPIIFGSDVQSIESFMQSLCVCMCACVCVCVCACACVCASQGSDTSVNLVCCSIKFFCFDGW